MKLVVLCLERSYVAKFPPDNLSVITYTPDNELAISDFQNTTSRIIQQSRVPYFHIELDNLAYM